MIFINKTQDKNVNEHDVYTEFGVTKDEVLKNFTPLLISYNKSGYGEMAETYILMEHNKNKLLYFVTGTECSVWDFNGQFEPELVIKEQLLIMSKNSSDRKELYDYALKLPDTNSFDLSILQEIILYGYMLSGEDIKKLKSADSFVDDILNSNVNNYNHTYNENDLLYSEIDFNLSNLKINYLLEKENKKLILAKDQSDNTKIIILDKFLHNTENDRKDYYFDLNSHEILSLFEEVYLKEFVEPEKDLKKQKNLKIY